MREEALPQPPDTFDQSMLFTLMAQHLSNRAAAPAPPAASGLVDGDLLPEAVSPSDTGTEGPATGRKVAAPPSSSLGL